jgi:hypothetical protein
VELGLTAMTIPEEYGGMAIERRIALVQLSDVQMRICWQNCSERFRYIFKSVTPYHFIQTPNESAAIAKIQFHIRQYPTCYPKGVSTVIKLEA